MATGSTVLFRVRRALGCALAAALLSAVPLRPQTGPRTLPVELRSWNLLANAGLASGAAAGDLPLPQWLAVSGATNAEPIEITTPIPHGLPSGETVVVRGVLGNTGANGVWTVEARSENVLALIGSAGSGAYAGGGSVFPAAGQPVSRGVGSSRGDPAWTPWFSGPASFEPTEFFRPEVAEPDGVVTSRPLLLVNEEPTLATSFLAQEIDGSRFRPGQPLCLSIEARITGEPFDNQRFSILAIAAFRSTSVYRASLPATLLASDYRRYAFCFALGPGAIPEGSVLRVEFLNEALRRGPIVEMEWRRPLLNEGTEPIPWTPSVEPAPAPRPFR